MIGAIENTTELNLSLYLLMINREIREHLPQILLLESR